MPENGLVVVDRPGRRRREDHLRKFLAMLVQVTDRTCETGDVIRRRQRSPVAAREQTAGIRAPYPTMGVPQTSDSSSARGDSGTL